MMAFDGGDVNGGDLCTSAPVSEDGVDAWELLLLLLSWVGGGLLLWILFLVVDVAAGTKSPTARCCDGGVGSCSLGAGALTELLVGLKKLLVATVGGLDEDVAPVGVDRLR